jgi:hypothetical protein
LRPQPFIIKKGHLQELAVLLYILGEVRAQLAALPGLFGLTTNVLACQTTASPSTWCAWAHA